MNLENQCFFLQMRVQSQQKSRAMSELEEIKQDIKDAKADLKRAEDRNAPEALILEINKRLNLLLEEQKHLRTG